MARKLDGKFLFSTALSLVLVNAIELPNVSGDSGEWLNFSQEASARSSGGRGGGGGFSKPSNSGGSRSRPSDSNEGGGSNRPSDSGYYRSNPGYGSGGNTVIIAPGGGGYYGGGYSSGAGIFPILLVLGMFGLIALFVVSNRLQSYRSYSNEPYLANGLATQNNERDNDIVTISKLQVALLAQTKGLQSELSQLTLSVNTETNEGLLELLQESALVLLRNSENWSHALVSSQSVNIAEAESIFNQISVQERSKFSAETLTNVKGAVRQKEAIIPGLAEDPGAYIVVTLVAGTANDQPLLKDVRSAEELQEALEKFASVPADYLMKFELLWSPQVETDSLTYDELLTEYTDMVQIA